MSERNLFIAPKIDPIPENYDEVVDRVVTIDALPGGFCETAAEAARADRVDPFQASFDTGGGAEDGVAAGQAGHSCRSKAAGPVRHNSTSQWFRASCTAENAKRSCRPNAAYTAAHAALRLTKTLVNICTAECLVSKVKMVLTHTELRKIVDGGIRTFHETKHFRTIRRKLRHI